MPRTSASRSGSRPTPLELTTGEMLTLFADCATRAERLRRHGAEVVFVLGAELSLMAKGFMPGENTGERVEWLRTPGRAGAHLAGISARVDDFLTEAAALVRAGFGGKITYAAVPFERVDRTLFDFVSVDLYRTAAVAPRFADDVRDLVAQGKPVAVTEFGAAGFRGAAALGARALDIVEYGKDGPVRLTRECVRDEAEQAACALELLEIFDDAGVDSAFVFTFALYDHVHRPGADPRDDLDLASYGIVKVFEDRLGTTYPGLPWEPKAVFTAVAEHYREQAIVAGGFRG